MLGPAYYLAGSSFPAKQHTEDALRARLRPAFRHWAGQQDILDRAGSTAFNPAVASRVELLRQVVPPEERAVLIGRSTGARTATVFAHDHGAAAVVCLGYPFRDPNHVLEPDRFTHLATLAVPTLIIQGMDDSHGGIEITDDYVLSRFVTVRFVRGCDHDFELSRDEWDVIGEMILSFCDRADRGLPQETGVFDEARYLRSNGDVAEAVRAGVFASGEEHYLKHGQEEGRSFRWLVP